MAFWEVGDGSMKVVIAKDHELGLNGTLLRFPSIFPL
jgi:hypothetical protein